MEVQNKPLRILSHLPEQPQVNIEFQDLTYSIPHGNKGSKVILRNVNGNFKSGQLTAILGPSGAGKSTLLNVLAGYKYSGATGLVMVNDKKRDMKQFRRISRYIMQEDIVQPWLTVEECMLIAANLKLGEEFSKEDKLIAIDEILQMLRLIGVKETSTDMLSGGEKKRLSIALELINNPSVIFLDEPTTGLDDLSSSQCVSLLKLLAEGGRTVICSIHTPSARLFSMFDHVYILSEGQCVFQGIGADIVPFLSNIGLDCPTHYNPADFIIDVASGEYGYHLEKLVGLTDNGRCIYNRSQSKDESACDNIQRSYNQNAIICATKLENLQVVDVPKYCSSTWTQFTTLFYRMWLQTYRNKTGLFVKSFMYLFLGILIGALFNKMGHNATLSFSNLCCLYSSILVFMYCPQLPVLLQFPVQVQLLKREYFNRWYSLPAYFWAMTFVSLPVQLVLGCCYIGIVYVWTDQPLEWNRIFMFTLICIIIALISEAIGLAISSTLSIVNGIFVGPTMMAPVMLLAVYGTGMGGKNIPFLVQIAMRLSYMRYGMEGLLAAIYGGDRANIPCPEEHIFCLFKYPKDLVEYHSFGNGNYWFNFGVLVGFYVVVKAIGFYLLRQRLAPGRTFAALKILGSFVKNRINSSKLFS